MSWNILTWSLDDRQRKEAFADGLRAFVRLYYDEYTDADEIEPEILRAMESLNNLSNGDLLDDVVDPTAEQVDLSSLDILIAQVEQAITSETGRRFEKQSNDDGRDSKS